MDDSHLGHQQVQVVFFLKSFWHLHKISILQKREQISWWFLTGNACIITISIIGKGYLASQEPLPRSQTCWQGSPTPSGWSVHFFTFVILFIFLMIFIIFILLETGHDYYTLILNLMLNSIKMMKSIWESLINKRILSHKKYYLNHPAGPRGAACHGSWRWQDSRAEVGFCPIIFFFSFLEHNRSIRVSTGVSS